MNQHDKKSYRAGYTEGYRTGKSKARIIHTTLVQRIKTDDEAAWEGKINLFMSIAIVAILALMITTSIAVTQYRQAQDYKAIVILDNRVCNELVSNIVSDAAIQYQECARQLQSHPIITEINVTTCNIQ